jgi:hypothetical protein
MKAVRFAVEQGKCLSNKHVKESHKGSETAVYAHWNSVLHSWCYEFEYVL